MTGKMFGIGQAEWEAIPLVVRLFLEKLIEENEQLRRQVAELTSKVEQLEARLAKNSGNSHKPPSSDGLGKGLRTQSERVASGKKVGGQPGHSGHTLMKSKNPDRRIRHRVERCSGCGEDLSAQEAESIQERQVLDVPPMTMECTAHELEAKRCPCCGTYNKAPAPGLLATESGSVIYGPGLRALCVYLTHAQLLPYERASDLIQDLFGQKLSVGTLSAWTEKAHLALASTEKQIAHALAEDRGSVHFDETGIRAGSAIQWLHSASTALLTYFSSHRKRGSQAMDAIGILPRFRGTAIHDRWESYFGYEECRHGLCGAHLLRDLRFIWEHEEEPWAKKMHGLLIQMNRADSEVKTKRCAYWQKRYRQLLREGLRFHAESDPDPTHHRVSPLRKRGRRKQSPGKNLLDALDKHQESVLLFLTDPDVPFTNNQAERDIRMTKVKLKISGCFRRTHGAEHFCRIRGYLSTARKQGWSLLDAMKSVFLENPFQPAFARAE